MAAAVIVRLRDLDFREPVQVWQLAAELSAAEANVLRGAAEDVAVTT